VTGARRDGGTSRLTERIRGEYVLAHRIYHLYLLIKLGYCSRYLRIDIIKRSSRYIVTQEFLEPVIW